MHITERQPLDVDALRRRADAERDALRRDSYRAVLLALEGWEAGEIAASLGRARRGVKDWAYAYRDGGVDASQRSRRKDRELRLPRGREVELMARPDPGQRPEDGVRTLRGKDVVRILEREFLVKYTMAGAYELLERLGYSCLAPRPRHEKRDPAGQ